eukprot:365340-Chlamydomonas_euryale.AAC.8
MAAMPQSGHLGAGYAAEVPKESSSPAPKESPSPAPKGPPAAGRDRALDQLYNVMTSLEVRLKVGCELGQAGPVWLACARLKPLEAAHGGSCLDWRSCLWRDACLNRG